RASATSALALRHVQAHGRADERLECALIDLLSFAEVDGTTRSALETGVEEPRRIPHRRPVSEGQLHGALIALAGAENAVVGPHRHVPLPLLDDIRIGFLDQRAKPAQCLAAPIVQLCDPCVDQPGRRLTALPRALLRGHMRPLYALTGI